MIEKKSQPSAVTIGTFDGFHLGHQAVIKSLRSEAYARCLEPIAIGFDRHPLSTISPERAPRLLCAPKVRRRLIGRQGVATIDMEFTGEVASMTAREYMHLLRDRLNTKLLIIGYDNTFGSDGLSMSVADYIALGKEVGIEVLEAPLVEGVSSSAIRKLVAAGEIKEANKKLGRMFQIRGMVVHGRSIGHTIGYPTANLRPDYAAQYPKNGVYYGLCEFAGGERIPCVINIGVRPTFGNAPEPQIEAHLLDFRGDIYGEEITLHFTERLRDEKKFADIEQLKNAIASDEQEVRKKISGAEVV